MPTDPDPIAAHDRSIRHRAEIEASETCGCFYCMAIFPPSKIERWIDQPQPPGVTAICPECGIDSVIGSASGYPVTRAFLQKMHDHWFGPPGSGSL